jgi:hypothetical protein
LRLWAAVCLALCLAFWLELDMAYASADKGYAVRKLAASFGMPPG